MVFQMRNTSALFVFLAITAGVSTVAAEGVYTVQDCYKDYTRRTGKIGTERKIAFCTNNLSSIEWHTKNIQKGIVNPGVYTLRAGSYFLLHRFDEALADYQTVLRIQPSNSLDKDTIYQKIGDTYRGMKRYDDAVQAYGKAIEFNPKGGYAFRQRAEVYKILGRNDAADADLKRAKELDPDAFDDLLIDLMQ